MCVRLFFFDATATPEIYTLSLHDALPICGGTGGVFAALEAVPAEASVLLVGHEPDLARLAGAMTRSEEHTSELQSHSDLVCRLLLEKKKNTKKTKNTEADKLYANYARLAS